MIIAFTGKKQSGKSTACSYIESVLPNVVRINFKDALVAEIKEKFPQLLSAIIDTMNKIDYDGMDSWTIDRLFKDKPPLMRSLMQNYGTDVCRGIDTEYWTNKWKKSVGMTVLETNVICDDVRFKNEADAVRACGGIVVRIVRTDLTHTDGHISETEQDTIVPDDTITIKTNEFEKLYASLDKIINTRESTPSTLRHISVQ